MPRYRQIQLGVGKNVVSVGEVAVTERESVADDGQPGPTDREHKVTVDGGA
ncbi:hypothetical protein ABE021_13940 [Sporosarcina gallistercoris]|uniref:hypothetical protein n=1 Tax=Sporosarcina gallistercoris TaxID=2762245 RepID=UPI003D2978A6